MIIKEVLSQLETANHPVLKIIRSNEHFRTIVIGMKKGMILKEHKTIVPTRLVVNEGSVIYKENEKSTVVHTHEDIEIPMNILHSLEASEDSLCFLIMG